MRRTMPPMTVAFTLTLFASAFLLFLVQPMVGKLVLPLFGGAPAVWNTCLVFFQALLLCGYAYAHASTTWLGARKQAVLHLVLLLAPVVVLPIAVNRALVPAASADPVPWLLLTLLAAVGLPFFVVSASAPLLQKWFADISPREGRDPYFLYAASNLGSMIALIGYPFLIEPLFTLATQRMVWTVGYCVLVLLIAVCALTLWRVPSSIQARTSAPAEQPTALTIARRVRWVLLALVPSSLLLGVTTYLATDVTAHPLLWLPPLVLYLLSFTLVFSPLPGRGARWLRDLCPPALQSSLGWLVEGRRFWILTLPVLVLILLYLMLSGTPVGIGWTLALHLTVLFTACMVCHGELAHDRPAPALLTEFFLWIAVGGVLGGLFNALVAPLVFYAVVEYPLALVLACLLLPPVAANKESLWGLRVEVGLIALITAIGLLLIGLRCGDGTLDASTFVGGHWGWRLTAVLIAVAVGTTYIFRRRDGRWTRAMDFLLPLALGVLVVGLLFGVAARPVYGMLYRIAELFKQDPRTLQKVVAFGLPAVLCFTFVDRSLRFGLGVGAFLLAAGFCGLFDSTVLYQTRDFYGVLQVTTTVDQGREYYCLYNGSTLHGQQVVAGADRDEPLAYYHRTGPIGQMFAAYNRQEKPTSKIGVIGLGTGALASYARQDQSMTFYEIDPKVAFLCREGGYFTYWNDAVKRGAALKLVLGDARLTLADNAQSGTEKYSIFVVDAFSSDAIPIHLIDREALALYLSRLTDDGVVAFHISNVNLDLQPVLANLAEESHLAGLVQNDQSGNIPGKYASTWVVLARRAETLAPLHMEQAWAELRPHPSIGVWTDDYSNLMGVLLYGRRK